MPTTQHVTTVRTTVQRFCVGVGIIFILIGLGGIMAPGLMLLHLGLAHNLIHLVSGSLALWAGYSDTPQKARLFSLIFGTFYALLGLVGFVIGRPGYPGVGHNQADQNLLRVVPNILELGTSDHTFHLIVGSVLVFAAYMWKRDADKGTRSIVDVQRRKSGVQKDFFGQTTRPSSPNSQTDLPFAELGKSDVNRIEDEARRSDFENRI